MTYRAIALPTGTLQVVGTSGDDHVTINQQGNGTLKVHADFLPSGNFVTLIAADVDKIIAYLCAGDDHFTIAGDVVIPAIVHGGPGDDQLNGGGGATVLLGEDGNDTIVGGSARDIIIGGLGADRVVGAKGEDILIGGSTTVDNDDYALMAILAAWNDPNESYENRAAAVDLLITVLDDDVQDELTGSADRDLFYDGVGDLLTDLKPDEIVP